MGGPQPGPPGVDIQLPLTLHLNLLSDYLSKGFAVEPEWHFALSGGVAPAMAETGVLIAVSPSALGLV